MCILFFHILHGNKHKYIRHPFPHTKYYKIKLHKNAKRKTVSNGISVRSDSQFLKHCVYLLCYYYY